LWISILRSRDQRARTGPVAAIAASVRSTTREIHAERSAPVRIVAVGSGKRPAGAGGGGSAPGAGTGAGVRKRDDPGGRWRLAWSRHP